MGGVWIDFHYIGLPQKKYAPKRKKVYNTAFMDLETTYDEVD